MHPNDAMPVREDISFADLPLRQPTRDALQRMGITHPTPIQADALPFLMDGRDLIGQARTGSGKTLAFGIPAVEATDAAVRAVQVLVLTPTRELAVQVGDVLELLSAGRGIKVALVYGGRAMGPQKDTLRRGAQIVVGTPGRVADLHGQGDLKLDKVRFLVLDEADEMLDRGFAPQVNQILSWTPASRQTALFSATMPAWVAEASRKHLRNPAHVAIDPTPAEAAPIEHVAYDVPAGGKMDALKDLLDARGEGQMIVFGRTKHGVKKLAKQLTASGYPVAALQGNLSQNARDKVMAEFRAGSVPVLLATNVAARGIDVSAVDHVVNYELPESSELLTHRIGRTGRMGRSGTAITLLGPDDADKWRQLEKGLGKRIARQRWEGERRPDSIDVEAETTAERLAIRSGGRDGRPRRAEGSARLERVASGPRPERPSDPRRTEQPRRPERAARPERHVSPERPAADTRVEREQRPERSSSSRSSEGVPTRPIRPASIRPLKADHGPRQKSQLDDDVLASLISFTPISLDREQFGFDEPETEPGIQARELPQRPTPAPRPELGDPSLRPTWGPQRQTEAVTSEPRRTDRPGSDRSGGGRDRRGPSRPAAPVASDAADRPRRERAPRAEAGAYVAICAGCGKEATLKFAPGPPRPVYCDDCFRARKEQRRGAQGGPSPRS